MPKQKYDWNKIKMEFMLSEFEEVAPFMKSKYNQDTAINKQVAKMTKWWWKEKQEYKQKIILKALEKQSDKDADSLTLDISFLAQSKNILVNNLINKLVEAWEMWTVKEITKAIESIRTEMWLPTKYTKNDNINKEEKFELNDEETEALKTLLKKK